MAAPFLVDQPELFVKLLKDILDFAGATDVATDVVLCSLYYSEQSTG